MKWTFRLTFMVCLHISYSLPTLDFASCLLVFLSHFLAKLSQTAGTCHGVVLSFKTAAKQYRPFWTTESEEVVYFSQCSLVHLWIYMFLTSSHMIYAIHFFSGGKLSAAQGLGQRGSWRVNTLSICPYILVHTHSLILMMMLVVVVMMMTTMMMIHNSK